MRCYFCRSRETEVIETRTSEDGVTVRRRRSCPKCKKRFTTYERIEEVPILVVKRDGRREQFDPAKLRNGIMKAIGKTQITFAQVDEIVNSVAQRVTTSGSDEVSSLAIGQMVADKLKKLDKVAYIRFASVFKRFDDVDEIAKEIKRL